MGYLAVEPGEQVKVLHLGSGEECGWLYASSLTQDGVTTQQGWLPLDVLTGRSKFEAQQQAQQQAQQPKLPQQPQNTQPMYEVVATRDVAPFPSGYSGGSDVYLAPVRQGERLDVMSVGSDQSWVYARRVERPEEAGWLLQEVAPGPKGAGAAAGREACSAAVAPPAAVPAMTGAVAPPSAPARAKVAPGDTAYHSRHAGAADASGSRATGPAPGEPLLEASSTSGPRCVLVTSVSGHWAKVTTDTGASGWVRAEDLSLQASDS